MGSEFLEGLMIIVSYRAMVVKRSRVEVWVLCYRSPGEVSHLLFLALIVYVL